MEFIIMKKIQKMMVASGVLACTLATGANAALYVSPAQGAPEANKASEEVVNTKQENKVGEAVQEAVQEAAQEAVAPLMAEQEVSFGSNVPVLMALENLVPEGYKVSVDEPIDDILVSWETSANWKEALNSLAKNSKTHLVLNEKDKVIGLSERKDVARMLARTLDNEWYLIDGRTMKQNFEIWGAIEGWEVSWDVTVDYPINHSAFVSGDLKEALGKLVASVSDTSHPISVILHKGNKVIQVVEGGFRREQL